MKLLFLGLLAALLLGFLSGCAGDEGYYTPSQVYAQHATYDPTSRVTGRY